eukprot:6178460-Pleurochrysis_carterae.AAC.1
MLAPWSGPARVRHLALALQRFDRQRRWVRRLNHLRHLEVCAGRLHPRLWRACAPLSTRLHLRLHLNIHLYLCHRLGLRLGLLGTSGGPREHPCS